MSRKTALPFTKIWRPIGLAEKGKFESLLDIQAVRHINSAVGYMSLGSGQRTPRKSFACIPKLQKEMRSPKK